MCPAAGMADAGRGDGCGGAAVGVGPAGQAAGGGAPAERAAAGVVRHPPPRLRRRGRIARSCTGWTRSRADAIAPTSSRTRWASASTSWTVLDHLHARPRLLQQARRSRNGAVAMTGERPVVGPDPPADGPGRLAGAGRLARRCRGRRSAVGAGRTSTASGSAPARTARVLEDALLGQAGPAAGAGRGPAQGDPRRRVGIAS